MRCCAGRWRPCAPSPVIDSMKNRQVRTPSDRTAIFLTDPQARVLMCWVPDAVLRRKMEALRPEPGYRFDEESTGTNAVGTALEERRATTIVGAEHHSEMMQDAACVAIPLHHPATRRLVGVVDLTCLRGNANGLLLPLAER